MPYRLAITSTGIVTSLGYGWSAQLRALLSEKAGLYHPRILKSKHATEYVAGEVNEDEEGLAQICGLKSGHPFTRTGLMTLAALKNLWSGLSSTDFLQQRTAFINANTGGGMSTIEQFYPTIFTPQLSQKNKDYIDTLDCSESTFSVMKIMGLDPLMSTLSTACSSSANAIIVGAQLIQAGLVDQAICGGADALSKFTFNGFHSLKNLDRQPCRPFDKNRHGLNLGEGAAYLLIEKEEQALSSHRQILGYLDGYSNTNDTYHPTAPSPDGTAAIKTMRQAIEHAGLSAHDIGFINAHGTGTESNDIAEGLAIEHLFPQGIPFSSTKAYTGHTLAASGAVEAIFTLMGLSEQKVFSNLRWTTPMPEISLTPTTRTSEIQTQFALSNSLGFGGNNVSLLIGGL